MNMHTILRVHTRFYLIVALVAGLSAATFGQSAARPDRGIRPVDSYSISELENISLTNGNVNLSIPLASLPPVAGGKLSWVLRAIYNSKLWDVTGTEVAANLPLQGYTRNTVQLSNGGGWQLGGIYTIGVHNVDEDYAGILPTAPSDPETTLLRQYRWKIVLTTPDGASHELRPVDYGSYPGTRDWARGYFKDTPRSDSINLPMRYYSFDGSFLYAIIDPFPVGGWPTNWQINLPDGTRITRNAAGIEKITDTNGNQIWIQTSVSGTISTTHYQDRTTCAAGGTCREILYVRDTNTNTGQIKYQTVSDQAVTPTWVTIDINFGATHVQGRLYPNGDPCQSQIEINTDLAVVRSIVLPLSDSGPRRQFRFEYNSDTTDTVNIAAQSTQCGSGHAAITGASHGLGSVSHMETPMGAIVDYKYKLDRDQPGGGLIVGARDIPRETIIGKAVTHDGITDSWNYDISFTSGQVSGPDGSVTTETYYSHDPGVSSYIGADKAGLVYSTNQSGKVLVERQWAKQVFSGGNQDAPGGLANFNPVVTAEYTSLLNSLGNAVKMAAKTLQYDFSGNVLSETYYDWIDLTQVAVQRDPQGVPTSFPGTTVLRTVTNSYYNPSSTTVNYAKRSLPNVTPLIVNAPKDSTTGTSQIRFSYEGQTWDNPPTTTGNLTLVSRFKSGTTWIDTSYTYDIYGNTASATDPDQNKTDFTYDGNMHAQPTEIKVYPDRSNPNITHTTTIAYDYWTGLVTSQADPNGNATSTSYDNQVISTPGNPVKDPFGRPGKVTNPQGRKVLMLYNDDARQVETKADLRGDDGLLKALITHDRLGRVVKVESSEDGSSYTVTTDTAYQDMGRIVYNSNPHRSGAASTDGWTRATKDNLGQVVEVATFDGATKPTAAATSWNGRVQTSYNAEQTTVTDQAGKQRKSVADGLGRLAKVFEDPGGSSFETDYSYDGLGNLIQVDQGSQHRYFTYDNLSRLITAKNPEQVNASNQMVATTYAYDDSSNLLSKTGPNTGSSVSFTYDGLNRVKTKTLSSGGTWDYTYDTATITNGKGRLVSVALHGATDGYYYDGYDAVGRVTASRQITTDGGVAQSYSMGYGYDLAGNKTSETYPSGRIMQTDYDSAGRVAGVKRQGTEMYYAGGPSNSGLIQYTAHGTVNAMQLGNGRLERTSFNSRLQPTQITLDSNVFGSNVLKLDYVYGTTTTNNGNVTSQTITVPNPSGGTAVTMAQTYTYDPLNRLATAAETGGAGWAQTYDYDRWGNRAVRSLPTSTYIPSPALTPQSASSTDFSAFNQGTNRLNQTKYPLVNYDNAGNLTSDASAAIPMTYDTENHLKDFNNGAGKYSYDGDGRRVKKVDNTGTTVFVYNVAGQLIAEYKTGTPTAGDISYLTTDPLGSTRLVTDSSGNVKVRYDYLPFGEEIGATVGSRSSAMGYGGADSTKQRFTQKERDIESGLDYFLARYYSSAQGRFTGPDGFWKDSQVVDPQSWNKYAYVRNNPLSLVDRGGEKATVKIVTDEEKKTGTITITASVAIYSQGNNNFTQQQLNQAAAAIQSSIQSAWSGTYKQDGITYTVTTKIDVQVHGNEKDATNSGAQNVIGISMIDAMPRVASSYVAARGLLSSGSAPDTGVWRFSRIVQGGVAAHEFTHLLGVDDRYNGGNISTTGQSLYLLAVQDDYRWALSGAIDAHRSDSRPITMKGTFGPNPSGIWGYGAAQSRTSTTEMRAAKIWWK